MTVIISILMMGNHIALIVWGLCTICLILLGYVAGTMSHRGVRRRLTNLIRSIESLQTQTDNLLCYWIYVCYASQSATLERIEAKLDMNHLLQEARERGWESYVRKIELKTGVIDQVEAIGLLVEAIQALAEQIVVDGHCRVCGSRDRTLLEDPVEVAHAHKETCTVPWIALLSGQIVEQVNNDAVAGSIITELQFDDHQPDAPR
jgi:hypothetical protein